MRTVRAIPAKRIVLYGRSLGTGVACDFLARAECAGVILEAPFLSAIERGRESFPFLHIYPDSLRPEGGLNNKAALSDRHPPVLILHGESDHVISVTHGKRLFAAASSPKPLVTVPGAGHGGPDLTKSPLYLAAIHDFLVNLDATPVSQS